MASAAQNPNRTALLSSFSLAHSFAPFYTGGPILFSPDAHAAVAFATYGDEVKVVRTADAHVVHSIVADEQPVTALALSPDGVWLAVASQSLAIRIYNVAQTLASVANASASTMSTASSSGSAKSGVVKPKLVRTLARTHDAPITVLEIDPSSSLLASGSSDSTVKVWDLAGGFCTHIFPAHGGVVSALCWYMPGVGPQAAAARRKHDDGQPAPIHLFTAAVDGRIRVWDLRAAAVGGSSASKRKPMAVLPSGAHVSVVRGLSISQDGLKLISGARDRTIALWAQAKPNSPSSPHWVLKELISAKEGVESVGFLPPSSSKGDDQGDQDLFYTAGSEGDLRIWNYSQGKVVLRASDRDPTSAAAAAVAAASSSSGNKAADQEQYETTTRAITQVQALPAAGALAVVHADQNIELLSMGPHASEESALTNGASLKDPQRSLLKPIRCLVGYNDEIIDLALLSPGTGALLPSESTETARPDDAKETHLAVCTNAPSLRVYSIPARAANASGRAVAASTLSLLHGHTDIALCLDRSPDGRWLASAGKDRVARIWMRLPIRPEGGADEPDLVWTCIGLAEGHTESVGALAFARKIVAGGTGGGSLGAAFLCSASQDRTNKVWDLAPLQRVLAILASKSGPGSDVDASLDPALVRALFPLKLKSLLTLKIHDKDINTLDVAPNNSFLASGSQDRTAKLFRLDYRPAAPGDIKHAATTASSSSKSKKDGKGDAQGKAEKEASQILASAAVSVHATATLTHLTTCTGHRRGIWSVKFSPVDPAFVTASSDRTIRMWSLFGAPQGSLTESNGHSGAAPGAVPVGGDFGRCVKTFESHSNSVLRVLFFNRGMQLLSAGADGTCRVWNVRTEENMAVLDARTKLEDLVGADKVLGEQGKEDADDEDGPGDAEEQDDEDEGAKVWALAVGHDLVVGRKSVSGHGVGLVSGGADSVIRFWEDQTSEIEAAKAKRRQVEVTREQDFANYLTLRDYRNAIALALQLDQPRRLLDLFIRVHASRPDVTDEARGKMGGPRSYLLAREGLLAQDSMTSILQSAGIIDSKPSNRRQSNRLTNGHKSKSTDDDVDMDTSSDPQADAEAATRAADARSITGLAAVDDVIRTLPALPLIQLLLYVRDWNSTVRTASVAQRVLHAILRFHSAMELMRAFERVGPKLRARASAAASSSSSRTGAAARGAAAVRDARDWGAVLDGLLPYTERHYGRADRALVESRTLEYTLAGMDAVLGPVEWDGEEGGESDQESLKGDGEDLQNGGGYDEMEGSDDSDASEE